MRSEDPPPAAGAEPEAGSGGDRNAAACEALPFPTTRSSSGSQLDTVIAGLFGRLGGGRRVGPHAAIAAWHDV